MAALIFIVQNATEQGRGGDNGQGGGVARRGIKTCYNRFSELGSVRRRLKNLFRRGRAQTVAGELLATPPFATTLHWRDMASGLGFACLPVCC